MKKHLLSLVVDKEAQQVFLHLDKAGVEYLLARLNFIKRGLDANDCPHTHLFSAGWGGCELSISQMLDRGDGEPVHHLKIYGWNDEWREKHGFERV